MEIMKGEKPGRQGGSGSQEQAFGPLLLAFLAQGHAEAMHNLGLLLYHGRGVDLDRPGSQRWRQKGWGGVLWKEKVMINNYTVYVYIYIYYIYAFWYQIVVRMIEFANT